MFMFFWRAFRSADEPGRWSARCAAICEAWLRDPLAHPALAGMTPTELADLPAAELRAHGRS